MDDVRNEEEMPDSASFVDASSSASHSEKGHGGLDGDVVVVEQERPTSIHHLPEEVLEHIFRMVSPYRDYRLFLKIELQL